MSQFSEIECIVTRAKQVTNDCSCVNQPGCPFPEKTAHLSQREKVPHYFLHFMQSRDLIPFLCFIFVFCLWDSLALPFKVTLTWCVSTPPMLGLQPHTILYYYSWLKIFVTICLNFSSQQGWRAPTLNLIKAFWTSWTIFLSTPEIHSGVTPLSSSRKDIFANGEFKKEVYWFFSYLLPLLLLKLMLAFSEWSITS